MKKYLLLGAIFAFCVANPVFADFSDVPKTHLNYDAINYVQEQGIVSGYADGTFKPDQKINRAEFVKITMGAQIVNATMQGTDCFSDVGTDWFAPYACGAKTAGIISGYPDGSFKPAQNISFVEAAKIIVNSLLGFTTMTGDSDIWYQPFVETLANKMAIPNTIINFDQEITRGEMAEMIYRIKAGREDKISRNYNMMEWSITYGAPFSADKNNLYLADQKIEGVDLATFELLGIRYFKDNKSVYRYEYHNTLWITKVDSADPDSFEALDYDYGKDKNNAYWLGKKIEGADPVSFEILLYGCAKDKNNLYFFDQKIEGADPATFEVLNENYAKDKNNVYWYGCHGEFCVVKIEGADPATFELLDNKYAKDKNNVYAVTQKIEGADLDSFETLDYGYAKDKNNVYWYGADGDYWVAKIEGVDPSTFEVLGIYYLKDKNNVYYAYGGPESLDIIKIEGADPATFEVFKDTAYAKDKNHVYLNHEDENKIIEGADPATFVVLNFGEYAKDKNCVYFYGKIVEGADPATFEIVDEDFAKDKNHVYYGGEIYEEPDPSTFVLP